MNPHLIKIRNVFLPLLYLALIFPLAYGLIYYLFYIRFPIIPLKEEVVQY